MIFRSANSQAILRNTSLEDVLRKESEEESDFPERQQPALLRHTSLEDVSWKESEEISNFPERQQPALLRHTSLEDVFVERTGRKKVIGEYRWVS